MYILPCIILSIFSQGLADNTVISKVNNVVWDLDRPLEEDCSLQLLKFDDEEAQAVSLYSLPIDFNSKAIKWRRKPDNSGSRLNPEPPSQGTRTLLKRSHLTEISLVRKVFHLPTN